MQLPTALLNSLEGLPGFDREAFIQRHLEVDSMTSLRLNPDKQPTLPFSLRNVPWALQGFYVDPRPSFTFDPFFHAGCYYVQEASSMLLEQAFIQHMSSQQPICALDLCAAPGGKTTHLYSLLPKGSVLVANEVIKSRVNLLRDNCIKWGTTSVVVTQNDPHHFQDLADVFDWITLDAPCSGSGLFRKDPQAISSWSESHVIHCAQRQQRIVAAAWQALKPGGILFYSTCSYSLEENENIVSWAKNELGAAVLSLQLDNAWGIQESEYGYRCWPHQMRGEGFYFCCLQKSATSHPTYSSLKADKFLPASQKENQRLNGWIDLIDQHLFEVGGQLHAWPVSQWNLLALFKQKLYICYAGLRIGQWMKEKFIPDHALALSNQLAATVPAFQLEKEQAINYLQRKEIAVSNISRGWNLVTYNGFGLGWANVLQGRINNYYPKEFRILKDKE
ncbi:MAG: Fmu (Sun) domain protein [Chitinophagaceae bacterium]|nr:Fmu (Sun) domain protein [Chitinophagaceae bacterium]